MEMNTSISKQSHHEQQELCSSRASYRQGRKLTAVKVYTVCDESTHLLVSRVPAIQLHAELSALCSRFGTVNCCVPLPEYDNEESFVETYHVQYARLQSGRFAKRQLDGRSFYGGVLHVCYAPELETVQETRAKLVLRRKEVASRVRKRTKAAEHRTIAANGCDSSAGVSTSTQPHLICQTARLPVVPMVPMVPVVPMVHPTGSVTQVPISSAGSQPQPWMEPHPSPTVSSDSPSQTSLRFIPRQVAKKDPEDHDFFPSQKLL